MIAQVNNEFEQLVSSRILEFFHAETPWHRGLWNVGSVLMLDEVIEAAEAKQARVLSESAFSYLVTNAAAAAGPDLGMGEEERRRILIKALSSKFAFGDGDHYLVAMHRDQARRQYLRRWADAMSADPTRLKVERTARAIASHLLDAGFSSDFLHRWWSYRIKHQPSVRPLAELVAESGDLAQSEPRNFEVLVAAESPIDSRLGVPPEWRDASAVSAWLEGGGIDNREVRQSGGLVVTVTALDPIAASRKAIELVDRFSSRADVSSRSRLQLLDRVWVRGETKPFPISRVHRGVNVKALAREGQVFSVGQATVLDASVELLSHLQTSSPSAAVAGGWAAIEALLAQHNDRSLAADRLAMLVTCSFPRAELTVLSYALEQLGGEAARTLRLAPTNRDRAAYVQRALQETGIDDQQVRQQDRAALTRMRQMLLNPRRVLADVHNHTTAALRRMYRCRNLVLHWGRTDAVCLRATLRTASPLVGAGFDRIVHAHYVDRLEPLELVARARTALATVGTSRGPSCVDLLS